MNDAARKSARTGRELIIYVESSVACAHILCEYVAFGSYCMVVVVAAAAAEAIYKLTNNYYYYYFCYGRTLCSALC